MAEDLKPCPDCGKVFSPETDGGLCGDCAYENESLTGLIQDAVERHGKKNAKEIARFLSTPLAKVKTAIRSSRLLAHDLGEEDLCKRCNTNLAQRGSEFCLDCRLEVHKSIGAITRDLKENVALERPARLDQSRMNIGAALQDKRRRTGTNRFDPTPRQIKR